MKASNDTHHLFGALYAKESLASSKLYAGKNPWAKGTINLTGQARILKQNPSLVAELKRRAKTA